MKKLTLTIGYLIWFVINHTAAQDINWRAVQDHHRHFANAGIGADFNTVASLAYGQKITSRLPIVVGAGFTVPFGKTLLDDWKLNLTAQGELWHNEQFSFGLKPGIVMRRFESPIARFYNISAEATATVGYLRSKWGVAAESTYDRSLATHLKHDLLKEYYPGIKDGWYDATGGTIKFGLAANYSFRSTSIFLKVGKAYGQNFKDNPTLPFYFDITVSQYFGER
ncbi:MAG: hypothetical protein K9J37_14535 [Saprospiraceae bacterium]|nr:hypothetical protein [Saprospiraceae bacterium]MCF8251124.1 hypothetical protein [Saprospiraceae bacterium]MCF8282964.1 hypothetical protein [Bacteroidales bacterium]MCF8312918.1 hypothetical protein [Saprospiraceae bacterium]MCF8441383.1 hypothetical protein [Saprospiraceae bacterium]